MTRILLLFILITTTLQTYSQISATTSTGRKVKLFDDGTWVYSDGMNSGTIESNDCEVNKYGKLTIKNKDINDAFVVILNEYGSLKYKLKIPKLSSKSIDMIPAMSGSSYRYYEYQVFLEEPADNYNYKKNSFKLNGNFYIKICDNVSISIDDL